MIHLRVSPPDDPPFDVPVREETLVVGRAVDCDLVINDVFLSRRHARLYRDDGRWYVEDLGSRNGTRLNGEPLAQPRALSPGDVIALSGSRIEVAEDDGGQDGGREETVHGEDGSEATYFRSARALLRETTGPGARPAGGADAGEEALRRWADRLHVINEVHRQLGRSLTLEEALDGMLDRVFDHLQPERGAVYLRGSEDGGEAGYRLAAYRCLHADDEPLRSRHLLREVAGKGLAALVLDARTDERFAEAHSMVDFGVRSAVAAPLLDGDDSLGMIALDSRLAVRKFEREDMELLVSLAAAAALRIRNLSLAEEAAERRRLESELALARKIQVALLTDRLPEPAGWRLHGGNRPSRGVSGDFYEAVARRDGSETFLVLADVSGKGMAASLLTASLEALLAPLVAQGLPPDEVAVLVGRLLYARTPPEKYATAVLAVLEAGSGRVRYAGAGHNPSLLLRAGGTVETVDNTGPPLGLLPEAVYGATTLELAPGDTLVAYTDGLVEATDPDDEEYGLERLRTVCARNCAAPPEELARELEADVERFVRGTPFADDRTLLLARRHA